MNDFNMVNVEPQSQVGKSIDTIKKQNLQMDVEDFSKLIPLLKQLQTTSSKILRQFDDYQKKKEKKTTSLPYNMIKKFQALKNQFFQSSLLLNRQRNIYSAQICNRDYQKLHEQLFFKKTMKSYDEKRLWMKEYILRNENKMQIIEEEVKKDVEYESHKFTQNRNDLNIQRLEHNYEEKIDLINRISSIQKTNCFLKKRMKQKLQKLANNRNKSLSFSNNNDQVPINSKQSLNPSNGVKLIRIPSYSCFVYFRLTKQYLRYEYFLRQTNALKKFNKRLLNYNKQLKLAIDKEGQKLQFLNSQAKIILHKLQTLPDFSNSHFPRLDKGRLTKTDYFIYLKEIQRHCNQNIQIFGMYFQYALLDLHQNKKRSKSTDKIYLWRKESDEIKKYKQNTFTNETKSYWQTNKQQILKEKQERQCRRKIQAEQNKLKQLVENSELANKQDSVDNKQGMILSQEILAQHNLNSHYLQNNKIQPNKKGQIMASYEQNYIQEEQFTPI